MQKHYNVYKNVVTNATQMENDGATSFGLFDLSNGNNGRDDCISKISGCFSFDTGLWELAMNQLGGPILISKVKGDVLVLDGDQDLRCLAAECEGLTYKPKSPDAIDITDDPDWLAIQD